MVFKKIYIIGSGSICVNIIKSLQNRKTNPIAVLYKEHKLSPLSMFLNSKNIEHYSFENKNEINNFLEKIDQNSLIISANNVYLFPKSIIEKENIKIVNFHNALLPMHRGMNAPTWTIYEQDKKAGITWHLVNENIDDGDIIIQKEINLDNSETAIILIRKLMSIAFCAYKEIEENLLNWNIKTKKIDTNTPYQIHFAKEIPNNGIFNKEWDFNKMSAFLRSLDWGCVEQFAKPKIEIDNKLMDILAYRIDGKNIFLETSLQQLNFSFD